MGIEEGVNCGVVIRHDADGDPMYVCVGSSSCPHCVIKKDCDGDLVQICTRE